MPPAIAIVVVAGFERAALALVARLGLALRLRLKLALLQLKVLAGIARLFAFSVIVIEVGVFARQEFTLWTGDPLAIAIVRLKGRLRWHLRGHDNAVIVLGVLEIILAKNQIAGADGVTRQGHIFFSDMLGGATDFYIRTTRFEAARQRALPLACTTAATSTTTCAASATAVLLLLSLPHEAPTGDCE